MLRLNGEITKKNYLDASSFDINIIYATEVLIRMKGEFL